MLLSKVFTGLGVLLAAMYVLGCDGAGSPKVEDKVVEVSKDDPEMNAAMAHAKSTLPTFWKSFDNPAAGEENFSLKVEINDGDKTEYFWCSPIQKQDGKVLGVINNDPNLVKTVQLGQNIEIPSDKIVDWMFVRNDKIVGNFTLRVLFREMPPEEVAKFKAMMEEP